jgi:hypothetical protein
LKKVLSSAIKDFDQFDGSLALLSKQVCSTLGMPLGAELDIGARLLEERGLLMGGVQSRGMFGYICQPYLA